MLFRSRMAAVTRQISEFVMLNCFVNLFICETGRIMRKTKCQSGAEKKKKKQRLEAAALSQKGALDRFVVKESERLIIKI